MESFADHHPVPKSILDKVLQYDVIGTGRLRTMLQRQGVEPTQRAQRSALISLAGRLIQIAADLVRTAPRPSDNDVIRLRALSARIEAIRTQLRESGVISTSPSVYEGPPSFGLPLLQEMERTVALITQVFQRDEGFDGSPNAPRRPWWSAVFLPDAFQNPEYLRFAFAGCLAASVCYVLYNVFDWRGISTSVLTCIVTALSTTGTSLQAQFLRLAGFVAGGLVLGISAQILILPGIDSIFGFALFFAVGTAIASWFATSSPRLSFFGVQMALAFYFVNLQDFQIQTDLTIARDKVIGALLGILAMGFIFDRFGTKSDAEQLQKLLVRNVRMLAELGGSLVREGATAVSQFSRLRSQINDNFASLESLTDAVRFEFEFRHRPEKDLAECGRIQRAQPALRSIYLLELSLRSHCGRHGDDSELTARQNQALDLFLNGYGDELKHVAAWIAHEEENAPAHIRDDSMRILQQTFAKHNSSNSKAITDICQKMVSSLFVLRNEC
jgi:multidrug resistance protein MdtO